MGESEKPWEFKPGNQFWRQRAKHGRDKLFETPELLWEAALEYFQWCDENPLWESQAKVVSLGNGEGSEVEIIKLPKLRAYTMTGICLYLDCAESYFRAFKLSHKGEKNDFLTVIDRIEKTIYNQKFTGASADLLNANIIARDLGLSEKSEVKSETDNVIRVIYEDAHTPEAPPQEPTENT